MIFLSNLNLSGCELQNAVIQNLASAPANPKNGQLYYDTVDNKLYLRQNGEWVVADGSRLATASAVGGILIGYTPGTGVEDTYAVELDSNGKAFVTVPWRNTVTRVKLQGSGSADITTDFQSGDVTLGNAAGKDVTDNTTDVALTSSDQNLVTGRSVYYAIKKAIEDLDVAEVGGAGKIITTISEVDGKISATAADLPTYTMEKQQSATEGYFATYKLKKTTGSSSEYVGDAINIPKDYVITDATIDTVTAADKAEGGKFEDDDDFQVGDKYIDLTVNVKEGTATSTHLYINVTTLIDVYTAGDGIAVSNQNVISLKLSAGNGLALNSNGQLEMSLATPTTGSGAETVAAKAGAMSGADKDKLDAIEDNAQENVIESISINGSELTPSGKAVAYTYKYAGTITGDGTTTAFTVNHALASTDVIVAIYDGTTNEQVWTDVVKTDANNVSVRFAAAPAASKTYRVVVIK
jgi:hypothetical protein